LSAATVHDSIYGHNEAGAVTSHLLSVDLLLNRAAQKLASGFEAAATICLIVESAATAPIIAAEARL
jgi:hypothetical protein